MQPGEAREGMVGLGDGDASVAGAVDDERERLGNKRVQVGFAQRSSSEVAMVGLRVEREGGVETSLLPPDHPIGTPVSITAGGLTAHFETRRLEFDFRRNGAIDPEDLDRE